MISQEIQDELHQQLLQERTRLEGEINSLAGDGIRGDKFGDDEMQDVVDQHPADEGSELFEREKNLALLRTAQVSLQLVEEALVRMQEGTYGKCEDCGKEIPEKRLRALPEATRCIADQEVYDRRAHRESHRA